MSDERTPLDRLAEFLIEETLTMSDQEILSDALERGEDPEALMEQGRRDFEAALARLAQRENPNG